MRLDWLLRACVSLSNKLPGFCIPVQDAANRGGDGILRYPLAPCYLFFFLSRFPYSRQEDPQDPLAAGLSIRTTK